MKKALLFTSVATALFLTSCSTKLSSKQRDALTSVAFTPTSQPASAYRDPNGAADGTGNSIGAASGGGLIGALVGEAVVATQNSLFKKNEGANFAKLRENAPKRLDKQVSQALSSALTANKFFGPRLRSSAPNKVVSEIKSYALTRTGKDSRGLLMSPQIVADVKILDEQNATLVKFLPNVTGVSSMSFPVQTYALDPALQRKGYAEAAQNLGQNFATTLAKKTAE